ncbi:hypothetical protein PHISCL_07325, partial [Aspergillus sclerotialis]
QEGMWEPVLVAKFVEIANLEERSATVSFSAVEEGELPTVGCDDILEESALAMLLSLLRKILVLGGLCTPHFV